MKITVPEHYWFFLDASGTFTRCSATQYALNPEVQRLTTEVLAKEAD
jgi:hypothetical protein